MKKLFNILAFTICLSMIFTAFIFSANANDGITGVTATAPYVECKSAILMEASTGQVLYEQNADEALPPASVTKIMTLLLVMEAIENGKLKYDDKVTASAHACSMGGSQIYLKEGEQMSVEDMVKSVVIASANDAAVALAEHISGSEEAFVAEMNKRAAELGMTNTTFENTNGLDDTAVKHLTSARDIAIMSRELIKHKKITEYSSIWMDTVRDGAFGLTNTNRLVRFYKGATGLKTGSTSKAGFCISATAERDGMELICVIMASPTRDIRNAAATALLDWGFTNHKIYTSPKITLSDIKVVGGKKSKCSLSCETLRIVVDKSITDKIEYKVELPENVSAPMEQGEKIGCVKYTVGDTEIGSVDIYADQFIKKITFFDLLFSIFCSISIF